MCNKISMTEENTLVKKKAQNHLKTLTEKKVSFPAIKRLCSVLSLSLRAQVRAGMSGIPCLLAVIVAAAGSTG